MRLSDDLKDHNAFFDTGYFVGTIDPYVMKALWREIEITNWIEDPDNIYKKIPHWYCTNLTTPIGQQEAFRGKYEKEFAEQIMERAPRSLMDVASKFFAFEERFQFFKRYFNDIELTSVDLWNGAENIDYHFDTINGFDLAVLIYLTDQPQWDPKWGGSLRMKREYPHLGLPTTDEIVYPTSGTYVLFNNKTPLLTHKVEPLTTTDVNRYTFTFNYNLK